VKRRTFVVLLSASASGCLGGSDDEQETDEVSLSSEDLSATDPEVSLLVEYSEEVLYEVRTESGVHTPDEGTKFLMVRTSITNVGGSRRDLVAHQYVLVGDGETYEPILTDSEGYVSQKSIPPGTRTEGWLLFEVPEETSEATLTASQDRVDESFSVEFSPNPGIEGIMR